MNRIGNYFIVILFVWAVSPTLAQQDPPGNGQLLNELERLEIQFSKKSQPGMPVVNRLANLELSVFGSAQNGTIMDRLAALGAQSLKLREKENQHEQPKQVLGDCLPLVNASPPNFLQRESTDKTILESDYIDSVRKESKGKVVRFKEMPIPVYISPYPDKNFTQAVIRGFEEWESRTKGAVRFVQIADAKKARILVQWKRLGGGARNDGCLLGAQTVMQYKNRGNGSVSFITMGAVPVPIYIPRMGAKYVVPAQRIEVNLDLVNSKELQIRYRTLQNILTHELGHALGLLGHSPMPGDMMHPITDEHSRLSQRDINTLKKLYNQKVDIPL